MAIDPVRVVPFGQFRPPAPGQVPAGGRLVQEDSQPSKVENVESSDRQPSPAHLGQRVDVSG